MNCKPGDLAVMVASPWPSNLGALMRVLSNYQCDPGEWYVELLSTCDTNHGIRKAGAKVWADDRHLRPLRGDKGADETLAWKEVPAPLKTPQPA